MFNVLLALACLNGVLFFGCRAFLLDNPNSGPEGLGTGLLLLASFWFSIFLTGFGINELLKESRHRIFTRRTLLTTFVGAIPLLFYILVDILPRKLKSTH
jgi:amino acid transporter